MTGIGLLLVPILVSAVAVFILSSIIHMALPWHKKDFLPVPDEDGVMKALRPFNIKPGDYMVPAPVSMEGMKSPEFMAKHTEGPVFVATFMPSGPFNMGKHLTMWFLFIVLVTAITAWVTGSIVAPGGSPHAALHYAGIISFLSYTMGSWPQSIWYQKKWSTTLIGTFDGLLYGLVTGAIFMQFWPKAM